MAKSSLPLPKLPILTLDEALAALENVRKSQHQQFPDAYARLEQLDAHMATVTMIVRHIHEEAARTAGG